MNEIRILNEQEVLGKQFKVYGTPDNPLFIAKDVAEWIDYAYKDNRHIHRDISKMLSTVDDEEKKKYTLKLGGEDCSHGGIRKNTGIWFLTEDGLYEVLMQSRKPIAKKFKKEVKNILKTIRKTGGYINNSDLMINTYFSQASDEHKVLVKGLLENIENQQQKIVKLSDDNKKLETDNKQLDTDNKALSGKLLDWADRDRINAGIRKLAASTGIKFGDMYKELYKNIEYSHKIYLNSRMERDKNKKKNASCLDYVRDDEWAKILKTFCAMCEAYGKSPKDMMQQTTPKDKLSVADNCSNDNKYAWLDNM